MAERELASYLEQVVRDAKKALGALGLNWALVGGLAVSARAEPRFTRDVDLAVAVGADHEAEALIRELQKSGYQILIVLEQETSFDRAAARRRPIAVGAE